MQPTLLELVREARQLQAAAAPDTAAVLTLLCSFTDEEASKVVRADELELRAESIAARCGLDPAVARDVIQRYVALDLADWAWQYAEFQAAYHRSGLAAPYVQESLTRINSGSPYFFLLYGRIEAWEPKPNALSTLIMGPSEFSEACKGYLVASSRHFLTSVQLLAHSRESQWPGWRVLWKWF